MQRDLRGLARTLWHLPLWPAPSSILKVLLADFFCVVPWSARVVSFLPHTERDSLSLAMHASRSPGPLPPSAAGSPGFWSPWMALRAVLGLGTWLLDGRN